MSLKVLNLGVGVPPSPLGSGADAGSDDNLVGCMFCGLSAGLHAMRISGQTACVLCGLVQSLHRPTIDQEVRLIWLPKLSQAVLNVVVRQIHIELRGLEESVFCDDAPRVRDGLRPVLYNAQQVFLNQCKPILERLGSIRAGDLADALTALAERQVKIDISPDKSLLGGLRALPTGRFYVGGVNVYEKIVDSWRDILAGRDLRPGAEPMAEVA